MAIQSDAEIVGFTHWTFEQIEDQDHDKLEGLKMYLRMKAGLEKQRNAMESQSRTSAMRSSPRRH